MNLDEIVKKLFDKCKKGLGSNPYSLHPGFYTKIDGVCNYNDDKYPVVEINNYSHFLKVFYYT